MTESQWAAVVTFLIIAGTRLLDAFLPKGYVIRWVNKYLKKPKEDAPEEE